MSRRSAAARFDPVTGAPIREVTVEIHDAELVDNHDRDVRHLERLRRDDRIQRLEHLRARRHAAAYERSTEMAAQPVYAPAPVASDRSERSFALGVLVGLAASATLALLTAPSSPPPAPQPQPTPPPTGRRPGQRER